MKMKSRRIICALLCMLCCALPLMDTCADTYTLHEPTDNQMQEEEAVDIACDFIKELTGVELTGLYMVENGKKVKNKTEAYFGPGYQWSANTEDDCWAITLRNETHINPFVVLHGTTGEVLYWEYHDEQKTCTYINMLPQEQHLSYNEAVDMAMSRYLYAVNGLEGADQATYVQLAFGSSSNWNSSLHFYEEMPAWNVMVRTPAVEPEYYYDLFVSAQDSLILNEGLFCRNDGWEFENITDQVRFEPEICISE